jgi:uncharacterized protein
MNDNRYVVDRDILVDGYNVIKNNVMFRTAEFRSLAEARSLLLRKLQNRYSRTTQRVVVVFDGDGKHEQVSHEEHICIIYSRYGETADSVIKRLAAEARVAGRAVEMYSDDEEVRQSVAAHGGTIQTTKQLVKQVNAAPSDMEARSLHRRKMRRIYGLDTPYKLEDEQEEYPQAPRRKKKKKSSRRR